MYMSININYANIQMVSNIQYLIFLNNILRLRLKKPNKPKSLKTVLMNSASNLSYFPSPLNPSPLDIDYMQDVIPENL